MIEVAAKLLDVKTDELSAFAKYDPYNPTNLVDGFICRRSDHRYGALVIVKINDWECQQVIYATPKLHYPFDKVGTYKWPDCQAIEFYVKLDGTNILAYHYEYDGRFHLSYKTRLTPFLQDQTFGMFGSMWSEYLSESPWVTGVISANLEYNLSFELYGSRNPITIMYEEPLAVKLLFGVRKSNGDVCPPSLLRDSTFLHPHKFVVGQANDLTEMYNSHRANMSQQNKDSLTIEGMVMYADIGEPSWKMFKCKPEEIEKIWKEALDHAKFVKQVNEIWILAKKEGLDVTKDKNATMRFMAQHFDKNIMRRVGSVILKQAGRS